jgi:hypothetical protein
MWFWSDSEWSFRARPLRPPSPLLQEQIHSSRKKYSQAVWSVATGMKTQGEALEAAEPAASGAKESK